ncbi:MAG: hypothetical protein A4E49_01180 [Methanosaeta sp. PtaU1.Bin112]|nr:MAG: hypothetical protein A4E49_01180 [Methanosaeta sp. PtaU1.Bin112]
MAERFKKYTMKENYEERPQVYPGVSGRYSQPTGRDMTLCVVAGHALQDAIVDCYPYITSIKTLP